MLSPSATSVYSTVHQDGPRINREMYLFRGFTSCSVIKQIHCFFSPLNCSLQRRVSRFGRVRGALEGLDGILSAVQ